MGEPSAAVQRSLEDLRSASSAISKFIGTWDGLRTLIDSINSSMDSLSAQLDATAGPSPQSSPIESPQSEAVNSLKGVNNDTDDNALSDKEESRGHESKSEDNPVPPPERKNVTEIDVICNSVAVKPGKRLRRYVTGRLPSGLSQLYDEIPAALARAQDPAALVLDSVGRFFKQGSKTFLNPESVQSGNRRAAILILEFFLLSGRVVPGGQLKPSLSQLANNAALEWLKRMLSEGGVSNVQAEDALGLLLLLASFGIPPQFDNDDIANLIVLSNPKQKVNVLRQSPILVEKVAEIIPDMVKGGKHIAAAELVIVFELQKKFPLLPLLSSYLDTIKRERAGEREYGQSSQKPMKGAFENALSKLQSLTDFVDDHGLYTEQNNLDLAAIISELKNDMLNFNQKSQTPNVNIKAEETTPLEKAETHLKSSQYLSVKRNAVETAPLERIRSGPMPLSSPTNRASKYVEHINKWDTGSLRRPSLEHLNSVPGPMNTGLSSDPLERITTYSNTPQILNFKHKETAPTVRIESRTKPLQTLNAKRKFEETTPLDRIGNRQKPLALPQTGTTTDNVMSSNMQGSDSLQRPSLEQPNSVRGPGNMQMSGPASTIPLNDVYTGMDSRFPGVLGRGSVLPANVEVSSSLASTGPLNDGIDSRFRGSFNHDHPIPLGGSSTSGYLGSGLPVEGFVLPSVYGSEMYDWYRDRAVSNSGIPTSSYALNFSQPGGGSTLEYPGAHPEVRSLSAGRNVTMHHVPLFPRETGSRAPSSGNRYNFADMV